MRKFILLIILMLAPVVTKAQFTDHSTGLLNMPSADMQKDGTFMITNNWLNAYMLPPSTEEGWGWGYDTFAYGFNITFLSRVEIAYCLTIIDGRKSPNAKTEYMRDMFNQDRHFAARVLVLREGELWKWTPSIAVGFSDPVTGAGAGQYIGSDVSSGNGYFNRFYAVATKHFDTSAGEIGIHAGYQYSLRKDPHINAPCAGINWKPIWLQNRWFSPNVIFEYDSRSFNAGLVASIWDDRFEAMLMVQNFRYASFGLRYKLELKH